MKEQNFNPKKITIIFNYESQTITNIQCNIDDKLSKVLQNYATKMGFDLKSIFFLYNGAKIEDNDYDLKIQEKIANYDEEKKIITILVYKILIYKIDKNINSEQKINKNEINVLFILDSNHYYKQKSTWDTIIKTICDEYIKTKNLNRKLITFKYNDVKIDLNKRFIDIVNVHDKDCRGMTINVYTGHPLKVKFYYKKYKDVIDCILEDKVKDIVKIYIGTKSLNIHNIEFYYKEKIIQQNQNQTFKQLININNDNSSTMSNLKENEPISNEKTEINIKVEDKTNKFIIPIKPRFYPRPRSYCENKKKIIIISIVSILILIIIGIIVLYLTVFKKNKKNKSQDESTPSNTCGIGYFIPEEDETGKDCLKCSIEGCQKCHGTYYNNECTSCGYFTSVYQDNKIIRCDYICETGDGEKCQICDQNDCISCNIGYILVDGKCKVDYHIKIEYLTISPNEEIDLISLASYYGIKNFFVQMIIEGQIVSPVRTYTFAEKGYHTVYFKLIKLGYATPVEYMFSENDRIMTVSFTDFNDYIPRISFKGMFMSCTNLTSVDMSKISFEMKDTYNLNSMFKNCINLKSINLKIYKFKVGSSIEEMFYNCISLDSVDLSSLNFKNTEHFDYMFYNCKSLKYINLQGLDPKSAISINYMFSNCISLESIDLSMFKSNVLVEMKNLFSNCISLIDINLNGFYAHNVVYMNNLFNNCTSLKSISLTDFDIRNAKYLTNMFGHCSSLEYIDIKTFDTNNVIDMSSMFSYCSSLEYIDISNFITNNIEDISSMFSHCYSLKYLDITNFDTSGVKDMNSMFSHCHSLTSINFNIEKFVTNKVTNLSYLFSHCYSLTTIDISNFDTGRVSKFDGMFSHCYSITSIDILHFNTQEQYSMNEMFSGCYLLTSIDLSNVENAYYGYYNYLFYDCPNLKYIDVSSFFFDRYDKHDFFNTNISSTGTIKMSKLFHGYYTDVYHYYFPPKWEIIFNNP